MEGSNDIGKGRFEVLQEKKLEFSEKIRSRIHHGCFLQNSTCSTCKQKEVEMYPEVMIFLVGERSTCLWGIEIRFWTGVSCTSVMDCIWTGGNWVSVWQCIFLKWGIGGDRVDSEWNVQGGTDYPDGKWSRLHIMVRALIQAFYIFTNAGLGQQGVREWAERMCRSKLNVLNARSINIFYGLLLRVGAMPLKAFIETWLWVWRWIYSNIEGYKSIRKEVVLRI